MIGPSGISVRGLRKAFRSNEVLAGLDLEVPSGSVTAVLGPSGSGKTTLLRVIAGFEHADAGEVQVADTIVDSGEVFVAPEHRGIGYVPQEGSLFPHLTVERNVAFGLGRGHKHGLRSPRSKRSSRVAELLEMVGLGDLGNRYPHQLSGGQQQRVALARALAVEPKVVLLDEPFSSLDAALRSDVRSEVLQVLREHGTTVFLVTHDQQEALASADQVAVIRSGLVAQSGTPQDLYGHPSDPEVADFLGDANLLAGTISASGVLTAFGEIPLRSEVDGTKLGTVVQVLLRPEQIHISEAGDGGNLTGTVISTEFHGHDCTMNIRPDFPGGPESIVVRSEGTKTLAIGTTVALEVHGSALAWGSSSG
jgi:iron(III) transport system ATP-binding protein